MALFGYGRRPSVEVKVGATAIGAHNPVRLQSMANTSTMDTEASVGQAIRIIEAGSELVRFTAQGVREAENLAEIRSRLRGKGYTQPIVADIHFNPKAAFAAAATVEKVRINPGNFVDPGRTFRKIEYTDAEYAEELRRLEDKLVPFLVKCRENDTAIRLGVNHGSLSDRIMSRYGDTPDGMVESAMEFLRVCRRHDFDRIVISIKASNVVVMTATVMKLIAAMDKEDMHFPLHLGVTEAGDGEDGRIKSALGIGTLLSMGIGDTIRVSLSEAPEAELPVARAIMDYIDLIAAEPQIEGVYAPAHDLRDASRRPSDAIGNVGGGNQAVVASAVSVAEYAADACPDFFVDGDNALPISAEEVLAGEKVPAGKIILLSASGVGQGARLLAAMHRLAVDGVRNPVIIKVAYPDVTDADTVKLRAAIDLGPVLLSGFTDGVMVDAPALSPVGNACLAFAILQSARVRFTHTEYISCPSCGRTLFDLQTTLARIKAATNHLTGLKIGVMGCIVNGPGEMADADYGYVGACAGHVSLYKGKECVERNIPTDEAVERLVQLIKKCGDWK